MIVLTFALPDESRAFIAALTERKVLTSANGLLPVITGRCAWQRVTVIHTGVGEIPVYRRRLERLLAGDGSTVEPPELLVSSGYAGGLQPGVEVGELILGENFSEPAMLSKAQKLLAGGMVHTGALTTQAAMAEGVEAKRALGVATGAVAVDLETAWIAGVCAAAGVPMLSLRVISDAVHQAFPVPGEVLYDARRQRPRYLALPLWLAMHPGQVRPFIRFVRGLGPARARLTEALQAVVQKGRR